MRCQAVFHMSFMGLCLFDTSTQSPWYSASTWKKIYKLTKHKIRIEKGDIKQQPRSVVYSTRESQRWGGDRYLADIDGAIVVICSEPFGCGHSSSR